MGYCESDCQYLSSRHNCQKYHKGLAYSKCSIGGASFGATHERCSECEKDHIIAELEERVSAMYTREQVQRAIDLAAEDGSNGYLNNIVDDYLL